MPRKPQPVDLPEAAADDIATGSGAPPTGERGLERAIGAHVRKLRHERDLSVSALAAAAGISAGMLSKIENGQISASLATLQSLAGSLGVAIAALFAEPADRRDASFVRAGQGATIVRRGTKAGHVYQLLGHAVGGDVAVEPFLITLEDSALPYTGFQHAGTELIYMLTGEVLYRHGDRSYHLRPGDSLMFDSAAPHGPEALLVRPMTYLSIIVYPRPTP